MDLEPVISAKRMAEQWSKVSGQTWRSGQNLEPVFSMKRMAPAPSAIMARCSSQTSSVKGRKMLARLQRERKREREEGGETERGRVTVRESVKGRKIWSGCEDGGQVCGWVGGGVVGDA